eukprot:5991146-Alexandrium_andersonii.AAC.1
MCARGCLSVCLRARVHVRVSAPARMRRTRARVQTLRPRLRHACARVPERAYARACAHRVRTCSALMRMCVHACVCVRVRVRTVEGATYCPGRLPSRGEAGAHARASVSVRAGAR